MRNASTPGAKGRFKRPASIAGSAQQQFGEFVDSPKHQVKGAAKKYAAQASDAVSDVTEAVRNNPLTGLIAAGAVGIVLGLLLGRK